MHRQNHVLVAYVSTVAWCRMWKWLLSPNCNQYLPWDGYTYTQYMVTSRRWCSPRPGSSWWIWTGSFPATHPSGHYLSTACRRCWSRSCTYCWRIGPRYSFVLWSTQCGRTAGSSALDMFCATSMPARGTIRRSRVTSWVLLRSSMHRCGLLEASSVSRLL